MFHSIIFLLNGDRYENISMANANRRGGGRYPIILAIFPRKSHKIEKLHGGGVSLAPLDMPLLVPRSRSGWSLS